MNKNTSTYNKPENIAYWGQQVNLQAPEKFIFSLYKNSLKEFTILDIGIGGGRTTLYFAPYVKKYVGIDIADEMIRFSKKRFDHLSDILTFQTLDASDLSTFKDNTFDFILFSFNGIDYMEIEKRNMFFVEIKRVSKNNGILAYSSHNLNMIHKYYENNSFFKLSTNPKEIVKNFIWNYKLRTLNGNYKHLQKQDWTIFNDGAHNFNLTTYYSKPQWEIKSLEKNGFKNIKVIDLEGKILNENELATNTDGWLYYLCTIEK